MLLASGSVIVVLVLIKALANVTIVWLAIHGSEPKRRAEVLREAAGVCLGGVDPAATVGDATADPRRRTGSSGTRWAQRRSISSTRASRSRLADIQQSSLDFLRELLDLARDTVASEKAVHEVQCEEQGKAALTELFEAIKPGETPVIVERVVVRIDEVVRVVHVCHSQTLGSCLRLCENGGPSSQSGSEAFGTQILAPS